MSKWMDLSINANKIRQSYFKGFIDISGGGVYLRNDLSMNFFDNANSSQPKFSIKSDSIQIRDNTGTYYTISTEKLLFIKDLTQNVETNLNDLTNRTQYITSSGTDVSNVNISKNLVVSGVATFNNGLTAVTKDNTDNSTSVATTEFVKNQGYAVKDSTVLTGTTTIQTATVNQNFFVTGDTSLNSNLFVFSNSTLNNKLFVTGDVSLNSKFFVAGDVSLNSNVNIGGILTTTTQSNSDSSTKVATTAFVKNQGYAQLTGANFTGDISLNTRLFIGGDASLNSNLFIAGDVSLNGNMKLNGNLLTVTQTNSDNSTRVATTAFVKNQGYSTIESPTFTGIVSIGTLNITNDSSLNGNLYVGGTFTADSYAANSIPSSAIIGGVGSSGAITSANGDFTTYGNLIVNYDTSLNSRLVVSGDSSFNGNLYVGGTFTADSYAANSIPSSAIIGGVGSSGAITSANGDFTTYGNLIVNYDTSLNSRLVVSGDSSFNGNLYVGGTLTYDNLSVNNNFSTLTVEHLSPFDYTIDENLFVLETAVATGTNPTLNSTNVLYSAIDCSFSGRLIVGSDMTTNKRLFTVGDASLNGNLFVALDTSLNGNLSLGKDLTIKGRLNVQNYTNTNIINTTVNNYQLIVSEDLSLNGRLVASGNITTNETVRYNKLAPFYTSVPTFETTDIGYVIKGTALISSLTTVSATVASIAIPTAGVWFIVAQIMYFSATSSSVEITSGIFDGTGVNQSSTKTTPVAMMGATLTHIHSGTAQTFTLKANCNIGTCSVDNAASVTFIRAVRIA